MITRPAVGHYDVLIVGGGLVGITLALALANQPIKVGIIESTDINKIATNRKEEGPALALSKASCNIFNTLGLADNIQSVATAIKSVHVSSAQHFGITQFWAKDLHMEALGQVIPAPSLLNALRTAVLKKNHIDLISPAQLAYLQRSHTGYNVTIKTAAGESLLSTRLLVAADGSESLVRRLLGITVKTWDHDQVALMATLKVSGNSPHMAYERFSKLGPLAALPLPDHQYALVWVLETAHAQLLHSQPDAKFLQELQRAWGYRLGRLLEVAHRRAVPLRSLCALQQITPGAVLLGNAAHTLHPIAAQGLNLSLRDTAALAQVIVEAIAVGQDLASLTVLEKYLAWRQPEQMRVLHFTHALNNIFSSTLLPVKLTRNLGLCSLGMASPVKHWLAKQAMGLSGNLPKLACRVML